jgi:hypothetical protein
VAPASEQEAREQEVRERWVGSDAAKETLDQSESCQERAGEGRRNGAVVAQE